MNASLEISHLREYPEWVSCVAAWHHREWLQGYREGLRFSPEQPRSEDVREREHNLRSHFGSAPVPATFIAHVSNPETSEATPSRRVPIGSISLVVYQFTQGRKPSEWVTNLYVEPAYRNRGVGQQLLSYVEEYALRHRLDCLRLYTRDQAAYYQKRNWVFKHKGMVQGNAVSIFEKYVGNGVHHDISRPASEA